MCLFLNVDLWDFVCLGYLLPTPLFTQFVNSLFSETNFQDSFEMHVVTGTAFAVCQPHYC